MVLVRLEAELGDGQVEQARRVGLEAGPLDGQEEQGNAVVGAHERQREVAGDQPSRGAIAQAVEAHDRIETSRRCGLDAALQLDAKRAGDVVQPLSRSSTSTVCGDAAGGRANVTDAAAMGRLAAHAIGTYLVARDRAHTGESMALAGGG